MTISSATEKNILPVVVLVRVSIAYYVEPIIKTTCLLFEKTIIVEKLE